ncbi:MAG TPA: ribonuclease HIII [Euryarchaeota archaeon]|nr:ribonuclease HIII [Euryarchaeota archaeon]
MFKVYRLEKRNFDKFREHLNKLGFKFEKRPHQIFLARYAKLTVNLYGSGKVTFGGKDDLLRREVEWFLEQLGATIEPIVSSDFSGITRIGTDEAGKGDLFGPLVVAGARVSSDLETELENIGVRDSKTIRSEKRISEISRNIKQLLGKGVYDIVIIKPRRFNELYSEMKNMNVILGWAHARAIENILRANERCEIAVADKFGKREYIERALMKNGRKIELIQMIHAERDIAVAAASILARDAFLESMRSMEEEFRLRFPRGASKVDDAAVEFVEMHGRESLPDVAKMNFSIIDRVL